MGESVTIPIDAAACQHAVPAASRLKALWPDITVEIANKTIVLASARRSASDLTLTWTCALLNEQLTVAAETERAQLLARLTA